MSSFSYTELYKNCLASDVIVLIWLGIVSGFSFGVILPMMKPFITEDQSASPPGLGLSETFYSLVIASFSIGEFIGSNVNGYVTTYYKLSSKSCLLYMNVIGIFGSILFAMSNSSGDGCMAFLGRLITGIWSGGVNITTRTHINKKLATKKSRLLMPVMASMGFIITLSMMLSPGIAGLFIGVRHQCGDSGVFMLGSVSRTRLAHCNFDFYIVLADFVFVQ
jgi:MFS family permease